jgi:hypothetical protein
VVVDRRAVKRWRYGPQGYRTLLSGFLVFLVLSGRPVLFVVGPPLSEEHRIG